MTVEILNKLHRSGFRNFNSFLCAVAYRAKGFGSVQVAYHPEFRAYSFKVNGVTYLSIGPGWAYNFDYLKGILKTGFCFEYFPKTDDVVVDLGAGLGEESLVFAREVGAGGKVHAIEANPVTFAGLKFMAEQNGWTWLIPHNLAIYQENGTIVIEDNDEMYLSNTIHTEAGSKGLPVKAVTFDAFVSANKITEIDFLKCNIEGAEKFLIASMSKPASLVRHGCISCHDFRYHHGDGDFYRTKDQVIACFRDHGFEVKTRSTGNTAVDDYVYIRNPRLI